MGGEQINTADPDQIALEAAREYGHVEAGIRAALAAAAETQAKEGR